MKKIITILTLVCAMTSSFAFEPKVRDVKCRNGIYSLERRCSNFNVNITFFTEEDYYEFQKYQEYLKCGVQLGKKELERFFKRMEKAPVEVTVKSYYSEDIKTFSLNSDVEVDIWFNNLENYRTLYKEFNSIADVYPKGSFFNKINRNSAECQKRMAISNVMFVTRKNFLTITKEEMLEKYKDFNEKIMSTKTK